VLGLDIVTTRAQAAAKRVLLVGVELISRLMNWEDRSTAVLFGDAAGAVVVGPGEVKAEVLAVAAGTDGAKADILTLTTGGTRRPFTLEGAKRGEHRDVVMQGREVFREAVHRMVEGAGDVLARIGRSVRDVALVIPHQANRRIIDAVAQRMGLTEERVFVNVHEYGNTGSASVPLALSQAREQGRVAAGDLVLLTAFGAGFHWAAAALQF
jgi:3-oxoacyl-[acyl-carrier-protein] synthase-3